MEIPNLAEEGQVFSLYEFEMGLSVFYLNVRKKQGQSLEYSGYLRRSLGLFYTMQIVAYQPSWLERYKLAIQRKLNYVAKLANGQHDVVQIRTPEGDYGNHTGRCYEYLVKYENLLFLETVTSLEEEYLSMWDNSPSTLSCLGNILPMSETGIENLSLALEYYKKHPEEIQDKFRQQRADFFVQVLESDELLDAVHEARERLEIKLSDLIS